MSFYEIVSDPASMTVRVGTKVFTRPILNTRVEVDFSIKEQVCAEPPPSHEVKAMHAHYCRELGPKFNRRFQAANYWLWLGNRMSRETANMLRMPRKGWRFYNDDLVARANAALPYVREAETDGLAHLIPAIVVFGAAPADIRKRIGGAAWRQIAHNSKTRNARLMTTAWIFAEDDKYCDRFVRLLDFPSGVLNAVHGIEPEEELIAARITPRRTPLAFQQTVHIVRDARRMLADRFNPNWGLARMTREHDEAVRERRRLVFNPAPFSEAWAHENNGFTATLLNNQLDIAVEGDTQHHCVGSYASMAAARDYAVLRIDGRERATAGYRREKHGWYLDQVYGSCNAPVSVSCRGFAIAAGAALSARDFARRAA
jgi:hypothetical protein